MNLHQTFSATPYFFLVIDTTFAPDNILERTQKLIMATDDKIRDGKLQYDINREASKTSVLLSRKIDKYEYLMSKEILPSGQVE